MINLIEGQLNPKNKKFGIIVSRFNDFISKHLLNGALDALTRSGTEKKDITIIKVPGAFEIPLISKKLAKSNKYNAIICLGAIIRGGTPHFEYVCAEVSKGISTISLDLEIPIIFGVLTTDSIEQAIERSGSKSGNKGWDAAMTAIEMANLIENLV